MNKLTRLSLVLAFAALVLASPGACLGQQRQNRANFDPTQARARMMERYRTQLDVTDDSAWTALEPRIQKVLDARRDVGSGLGGGMFRGGRGGAANDQTDATQGNRRGRRNNAGTQDDQTPQTRTAPQLSPAAQDLRQAVDAKASPEDIKTKLASFREERKAKQAKLESAQEDLRKVLSVRQEASAVLMGLLQ